MGAADQFTDVVIELHGASDSSRRSKESLGPGLDFDNQNLAQYRLRQQMRKEERLLRHFMQGVQDEGVSPPDRSVIDPTIIEVARLLDNGHRLGGVFIAGFSLGTWYAIMLTDIFVGMGIAVTFTGLSDMPLFPYGMTGTSVPRCDRLKPLDWPSMPKLGILADPLRASYPPEVTGPDIGARHKRNYYQNAGNGVVPTKRYPYFWWSSNMPNNEIHGRMRGNSWRNTEIQLSQNNYDDSAYHNSGDALGMQRLGADIARGLGMVWELTGAGLVDF